MQVSDIMTNRVISVVPDEAIDAAIELMLKHHISGLPVIGDKGETRRHYNRERFFAPPRDEH